jgi:mannose/cellobiose epimerase-like protein (N-acyl-D-glucosamine 2-epimerase family)
MPARFSVHGQKWVRLTGHRTWLLVRANDLLDFFEGASVDPAGGFRDLADDGKPLAATGAAAFARQVQATARMVHCFAIAHLMGRPGAAAVIDHGMDFLWNKHRDRENGGYFWQMGDDGPVDDSKQAYGHAFVLLAASSAKAAGHPDADRLLADVTAILNERFWEEQYGAVAEEFTRDWQPKSPYRGQNANMHLTEALMAAFEVTDDGAYLAKAERIADLLICRAAGANGWHLPEHFTRSWQPDADYVGDPMFHPPGTTPAIR